MANPNQSNDGFVRGVSASQVDRPTSVAMPIGTLM